MPPAPTGISAAAPGPATASSGTRDPVKTPRSTVLPHSAKAKPARFRADIQGLRALAVGLVVFYHIWPAALPGGFVGVDVFFVISGYLIVGSLVRELTQTGTIRLIAFYGRRIRRLLPAAATVLIATLAATVLIFPEGRWQGVSRDAVASSLNVQNWNQAFSSTSYAGATSAVSPLQHYWSLAVEEQFYLVIPVLLLAFAAGFRAVGMRIGRAATALWAIGFITALSFIHSVLFSASSPDLAYFFTTTRMWELGLGGILALAAAGRSPSRRSSITAGWAGVSLICFSAATFTTDLAFPGWVALVPTIGAALCLLAGHHADPLGRQSAGWWQSLRPVAYLGDISYSLYLWHWPLTVFGVYLLGQAPGPAAGTAIIVASLAAAVLSTRFVEKPFRAFGAAAAPTGRHSTPRITYRSVYLLAGVLIIAPVAASAVPYVLVQQKIDALAEEFDFSSYPGAMAFDTSHPAAVPSGQPLRPAPAAAIADQPAVALECLKYDPAASHYSACVYGDPDATKSIALVGDSHAAQFMTPLDIAARENGYRLYVLTRIGCPFNANPLHSATVVYTNCSSQNTQTVQDLLEIRPDLVVTTAMKSSSYEDALGWVWDSSEEAENGYSKVLEPLQEAGIRVAVIADIPYPGFDAPDCVLEEEDVSDCSVLRSAVATQTDPLSAAAEKLADGRRIDLTDYFCDDTQCPSVIGNVLVYRDNHITNTFARTLTLPLQAGLGL